MQNLLDPFFMNFGSREETLNVCCRTGSRNFNFTFFLFLIYFYEVVQFGAHLNKISGSSEFN